MTHHQIEQALRVPFDDAHIMWRVQTAGIAKGRDGERPWVRVLAYVDARAVQERLDLVFGVDGWETSYTPIGTEGYLCRLITRWPETPRVEKEDGADRTDTEGFKGGISKAFVRVAAAGYGIGRYLYDLPESYPTCITERPARADAAHYTAQDIKSDTGKLRVWWVRPQLPAWALPTEDHRRLLAAFVDGRERFPAGEDRA